MTKKCGTCKIEKEINADNFAKRKNSKDGFDSQCKECKRKYDLERYKIKRMDILKQKKEYYGVNKGEIIERQLDYYYENQKECRQREKEWRKNNPHKRRVINERRRTRERNLPSTLDAKEWIETKTYFDNACAYCGLSEERHLERFGELLHQEHFIPLLKGGTHDKGNIIPSCRSCNSSKANNDFNEWYSNQECYSEERKIKILNHLNALQKKVII